MNADMSSADLLALTGGYHFFLDRLQAVYELSGLIQVEFDNYSLDVLLACLTAGLHEQF